MRWAFVEAMKSRRFENGGGKKFIVRCLVKGQRKRGILLNKSFKSKKND